MTPVFAVRRRAEEFDELLARGAAGDGDLADTRFAELAGAIDALREATPVAPRADFAVALRARLLLAAEDALAAPTTGSSVMSPATSPTSRRTRRERRVVAALGGFAIVAAGTSMAVAAQTALPGDTLYPLKRAIERAHADVQSGDGRGTTMLHSASGRLREVDELSRNGSESPEVIAQTLQSFSDQAQQASDVMLEEYRTNGQMSTLQQLRAFTSDAMATLSDLEDVVPAQARASLVTASQTLSRIDQQALDACPGCAAQDTVAPTTLTSQGPSYVLGHLVHDATGTPAPRATHRHHRHHTGDGSGPTSSGHQPGTPSPADPTPGTGPDTPADPGSSSSSGPQPSASPVTSPPTTGLPGRVLHGAGSGKDSHSGKQGSSGNTGPGGLGGLIGGVDDTLDEVLDGD